jgi:hydrogenase nickel incorporation protein HypB
MCAICGCGDGAEVRVTAVAGSDGMVHGRHRDGEIHVHDGKVHVHDGEVHVHVDHTHPAPENTVGAGGRTMLLEQQILAKNDSRAEANRHWFGQHGILAVNMMSSPGSGKTTLLERTIRDVGDELAVFVIEGDQETPLDAERIRAAGRPVVQVNTGAGCHLDADMVKQALAAIAPGPGSTVFIENVGNLVCPALFDLGEGQRVVMASVTEGADKPRKYPYMFRHADLVVLNKVDLLPYVDFDVAAFTAAVRLVNPTAEVATLSATNGKGLEVWYFPLESGQIPRLTLTMRYRQV